MRATLLRAFACLALPCLLAACHEMPGPQSRAAVRIAGTVWQPDGGSLHPQGIWERLGARTLLVQWTAVDDTAFVEGCNPGTAATLVPDWQRIAREPWAQDVILGLAGRADESVARGNLPALAASSRCLASLATPLHVTGWFFPVEADPSWQNAPQLAAALKELPRPLWISVYDRSNVGPDALVAWLDGWLPKDVGIFFQDGVGVHARTAPVARDYLEALQKKLGRQRVRLIAEAFRPQQGGGFRPATADELVPQLAAYGGQDVFLFDGPHYVGVPQVEALRERLVPAGRR